MQLLVYGQSVGSGPSCYLAASKPVAGTVHIVTLTIVMFELHLIMIIASSFLFIPVLKLHQKMIDYILHMLVKMCDNIYIQIIIH